MSDERRQQVMHATAYVQSRFYPPLPTEYGELAVQAVERVNAGDDTPIDVSDVNPQPRASFEEYGRTWVAPGDLVEALRLHHMIETDD